MVYTFKKNKINKLVLMYFKYNGIIPYHKLIEDLEAAYRELDPFDKKACIETIYCYISPLADKFIGEGKFKLFFKSICIKLFIKFLIERNLSTTLLKEIYEQHKIKCTLDNIEIYLYRCNWTRFYDYVNYSFIWGETSQGWDFWCNVHNDWHDYLYNYLFSYK